MPTKKCTSPYYTDKSTDIIKFTFTKFNKSSTKRIRTAVNCEVPKALYPRSVGWVAGLTKLLSVSLKAMRLVITLILASVHSRPKPSDSQSEVPISRPTHLSQPGGPHHLSEHQLCHDFHDHPHHHQAACHSTNCLVTSQTTHGRATPPAAAPAGRPLSAAPPAAHRFAVCPPAPLSGSISVYSQNSNTARRVITVTNQTQQRRENMLPLALHVFPLFLHALPAET